MWNSCAKSDRLKTAIRYRGLDPDNLSISKLAGVLRKRGITDKVQNDLIWDLISYLEPPGCRMSHCKFYGNQGFFCNCSKEKVPGRCKIYRDFKKRKKDRAVKATNELIELLKQHLKKTDVFAHINFSVEPDFFDALIKEDELFGFIKKWNYTLRYDVWRELKKRKKRSVLKGGGKKEIEEFV